MKIQGGILIILVFAGSATWAHHNPVVYDGKVTVKITGTVAKAHFGFPHSRYALDVQGDDGSTERWTLMTEDPRDAKSLGFDDELKAIKVGDTLTAVGWPNKVKAREIRGHQLHYDDGSVVMLRRGNYIWTKDLRRIWQLRSGQEAFGQDIGLTDGSLSPVARVISWIEEDDAVSRIAFEITEENARLIGINRGDGVEFPGVQQEYVCHTKRDDFRINIDFTSTSLGEQKALSDGNAFIRNYNNLLSKYWEYDIESC
jgi:hypothetical protein